METYATVKGQIVIPVELRRKYGIVEGTKIIVVDNGDEIVLRPITHERIAKLRGSLKGTGALDVLIKERQKDQKKDK